MKVKGAQDFNLTETRFYYELIVSLARVNSFVSIWAYNLSTKNGGMRRKKSTSRIGGQFVAIFYCIYTSCAVPDREVENDWELVVFVYIL